MKANLLRERLERGEVALGHMITEFSTRGIAKIVESAGLDFVLLDMEHSGLDLESVADLIAWFKATPVAPIVRVPSPLYHFIARSLDAGALGVMVPNVETLEQARTVVGAVKYAPEGKRGLGLGAAHNDYIPPDPVRYMRDANRSTVVICQIESRTGLGNIDSIASLPGVDIVWVGQFDLSQSMGLVGRFEDPSFTSALSLVVETARRHGKAAGIQPGNRTQASEWIGLGFNVISCGTDVAAYRSALVDSVKDARDLARRTTL